MCINEAYVQIIEDINENAIARIHLENDVSKVVKVGRGVRQGDTLSPKIFTAAMEEVLKNATIQGDVINIDGEQFTKLRMM